MTDAEMKKIHGNDVELAPDDTEDEKLTEEAALKRAKKEGIEFVDVFQIRPVEDCLSEESAISSHDTRSKADTAMAEHKKKKGGEYMVVQIRARKQPHEA